MLVNSRLKSRIIDIKRVLNESSELFDNNNIKSSWDSLVIESTSKWEFKKKELFRNETNEKSEMITFDILSQFNESVSHSWSEFLYVWIQEESKKLLKLFIYSFITVLG